ncbi:MAG: hypothetical protein V1898_05300 [Patescibacteria group bacterium]
MAEGSFKDSHLLTSDPVKENALSQIEFELIRTFDYPFINKITGILNLLELNDISGNAEKHEEINEKIDEQLELMERKLDMINKALENRSTNLDGLIDLFRETYPNLRKIYNYLSEFKQKKTYKQIRSSVLEEIKGLTNIMTLIAVHPKYHAYRLTQDERKRREIN